MNTSYRLAQLADAEELTIMSMELYNEVVTLKDFTENRIVATILFYEQHSDMGEVLMIDYEGRLAGYSIIFKFWSNEYGGLLIGIDELYIKKEFRHGGIAWAFINSLINAAKQNNSFVGIELESHINNEAANKLYASLGAFKKEQAAYIKLLKKE